MRKLSLKIGAVVFVLSYIFVLSYEAHAERLYFFPQNISVSEGDSFVVEVGLDTEGESINAIDIEGSVGAGIIESINTSNSLIQIFVESAQTGEGTFRFTGGTPGGFEGDGVIGRLNVRATETGIINIDFDKSAKVLTALGQETAIPLSFIDITANISPPSPNRIKLSSRSHPDENKWYRDGAINIHWDLEDRVEYSYLISRDQSAVPDEVPNRPEGNLEWQGDISIEGLDDGIFYFTVKRLHETDIARFRTMIDSTPPEWVAFEMSEGVPETNDRAFLTFVAKDELSGISHYKAIVDEAPAEIIAAPYILPDDFGIITIIAYDKAGNSVERTIIGETQRNVFVLYVVVLLIVIGGAVVAIRPIRERIFTEKSNKED